MDNKNVINLINGLLFFSTFIVALIIFISIINYVLYTIYTINANIKEYTYNSYPFFKLNQIYNYMLINYVYLFNNNKNIKYKKNNERYHYVSKETVKCKSDIDAINCFNKYIPNLENENMFIKDYEIEIEKDENKKKIFDKLKIELKIELDNYFTKYIYFNDYSYIKKQINKNKTDKYVYILYDYHEDYYIYCKYDKIDDDISLIDSIFKIPYELLNFTNSHDHKTTDIYILFNNKLYELLFLIIFIIFFAIILIIFINISNDILNITSVGYKSNKNIIKELFENNKYIIIAIIVIIIYCILHSIQYYYIFINNVYNNVYNKYLELIKIDEYIKSIIGENIIKYNNNNYSKILDNFKKLSIGGDNVMKRTTIIDFNSNISTNEQLEKYSRKIMKILNYFNLDGTSNIYYIQNIIEIVNKLLTNVKDVSVDNKNIDEAAAISFLLIIYIYFIKNNKDDPYIIIKLNKLLFGENIRVGVDYIDKDIEYTLTLRSLLYNKINIESIKQDLNNLRINLINKIFPSAPKKTKDSPDDNNKDNFNDKIENYINEFVNKINEGEKSLDFFLPVYFINLYMALEILIGCIALMILISYFVLPQYDSDEIKKFIENNIYSLLI